MASPVAQQLDELLSEDMASVRNRERSAFDRTLAGHSGRLVLFGAGSLGRTALRCLLRDGIRPLAISDNNSSLWGTDREGVPVLSPVEAAARFGADTAFFVTIWTDSHRYAESRTQLTSLGCNYVYPAASLRWKYSADLLPYFCQDLPHHVYQEADRVRAAFQLWSDERSREEYLAQIRYRALGDWDCLSPPDPEPSYFPDSLFSLRPDEVFIDCGAYDGDTIREVLHRRGDSFSKLLALEPDPHSFEVVLRYIASLPPAVSSRISAYPYAASSSRSRLRFNGTGEVTAAISTNGEIVIEAVALDELLQDLTPTFVKMDIEGAEIEALEGARKSIADHHPILSICLYHRQSDLWRIPLLIHSIHSGYRHFLRAHETDGWQTVGYAVPPERAHV